MPAVVFMLLTSVMLTDVNDLDEVLVVLPKVVYVIVGTAPSAPVS